MGAAAAGAAATAMFFDLKADAASGHAERHRERRGFRQHRGEHLRGGPTRRSRRSGGPAARRHRRSRVPGGQQPGRRRRGDAQWRGLAHQWLHRWPSTRGLEALGSERRISLGAGPRPRARSRTASRARPVLPRRRHRRPSTGRSRTTPLTAPDLGLTEAANRALESANLYRGAARDLGGRCPRAPRKLAGAARCRAQHRRGRVQMR